MAIDLSLHDLHKYALSNLTDHYLQDRYHNDYTWSIKKAFIKKSKDFLELDIQIMPTYHDDYPKPPVTPSQTTPRRYMVYIRCYDISTVIPDIGSDWSIWDGLSDSEKTDIIKQIFKSCKCRVHSDDPSFYWQGMWEDLSKHDGSIFKFTGTPGKGIWRGRHARSNSNPKYDPQFSRGQQSDEIRVTKHIAQISYESDSVAKAMSRIVQLTEQQRRDDLMEMKLNEDIFDNILGIKLNRLKEEKLSSILKKANFPLDPEIKKEDTKELLDLIQTSSNYFSYQEETELKNIFSRIGLNNELTVANILKSLANTSIKTKQFFLSCIKNPDVKNEAIFVQYDIPVSLAKALIKQHKDSWGNISDNDKPYVLRELEILLSNLFDLAPDNKGMASMGKGEVLMALIGGPGTQLVNRSNIKLKDNTRIEIKARGGRLMGSATGVRSLSPEEYEDLYVNAFADTLNLKTPFSTDEIFQNQAQGALSAIQNIKQRPGLRKLDARKIVNYLTGGEDKKNIVGDRFKGNDDRKGHDPDDEEGRRDIGPKHKDTVQGMGYGPDVDGESSFGRQSSVIKKGITSSLLFNEKTFRTIFTEINRLFKDTFAQKFYEKLIQLYYVERYGDKRYTITSNILMPRFEKFAACASAANIDVKKLKGILAAMDMIMYNMTDTAGDGAEQTNIADGFMFMDNHPNHGPLYVYVKTDTIKAGENESNSLENHVAKRNLNVDTVGHHGQDKTVGISVNRNAYKNGGDKILESKKINKLFASILEESKEKQLFEKILQEERERLQEMAIIDKRTFASNFCNYVNIITKEYQNYNNEQIGDRKVIAEAVHSVIEKGYHTINPFAIRDNNGKVIVATPAYQKMVEEAAKERLQNDTVIISNKKGKCSMYRIEQAQKDIKFNKELLKPGNICVDKNGISRWIKEAVNDVTLLTKNNAYKEIIVNVFMILYEALPNIPSIDDVQARLKL
jgi:hypothetical protein